MAQSKKPTLICLHGALGCAEQLESSLTELEKHFVLKTVEFPGHGKKAGEKLDLDGCLHASKDFILKNKLAGTAILGYSMGGFVALLLALKYPELVGQIITLGTKLDWNAHFAEEELKKLNPEIIQEKIPHYAQYLEKWHGDSWKKVVAQTGVLMRNLGDSRPLNDDVYQRIMHPVLLCLADADNMVTREETVQAARMIPFGEFAEISNSGHPIEKVDLEELHQIIRHYV